MEQRVQVLVVVLRKEPAGQAQMVPVITKPVAQVRQVVALQLVHLKEQGVQRLELLSTYAPVQFEQLRAVEM